MSSTVQSVYLTDAEIRSVCGCGCCIHLLGVSERLNRIGKPFPTPPTTPETRMATATKRAVEEASTSAVEPVTLTQPQLPQALSMNEEATTLVPVLPSLQTTGEEHNVDDEILGEEDDNDGQDPPPFFDSNHSLEGLMDDLLSMDGNESTMQAPTTDRMNPPPPDVPTHQHPSSSHTYNNNHDNNTHFRSSRSSSCCSPILMEHVTQTLLTHAPDSPDPWRLANAVHMELQENAKLPIFHWNVDRTGSSVAPFVGPWDHNNYNINNDGWKDAGLAAHAGHDVFAVAGTTTSASSAAPPSTASLMELFLSSERRAGQQANYAHTATTASNSNHMEQRPLPQNGRNTSDPLTSTTTDHPSSHVDFQFSMTDLEDLTNDDFNPTTLSEIKWRHAQKTNITGNSGTGGGDAGQQAPSTGNATTDRAGSFIPPYSALGNNKSYLQRRQPLPIPTSIHITSLIDAQHNEAEAGPSLPEVVQPLQTIDTQQSIQSITASDQVMVPRTPPPVSKSMAAKPPAKHSVAHSVVRPALQNASQQHSQYGFGRKHVVPSVPTTQRESLGSSSKLPPTIAASLPSQPPLLSSSSATTTTTKSASSNIVSGISCIPPVQSSQADDESVGGANEAYERKKQRAKTARVRLNESIDRLQIAINLAGTQSIQRVLLFDPLSAPHRIIQDCVKCSKDAKKWDRPSFVGSAASMIQALNAQCEALVRALHEERMSSSNNNKNANVPANENMGSMNTTKVAASSANSDNSCVVTTKHPLDDKTFCGSNGEMNDGSSVAKRIRPNGSHAIVLGAPPLDTDNNICLLDELHDAVCPRTDADLIVFSNRKIVDRIASFLEPLSTVRCMRVSKAWKDWGIFSNDLLWQNLAAARFGFYNVRQWRSRLEDAEATGDNVALATRLYRTMDSANVMPQVRQEGLLLMGESRLVNKVSAWTFLVERSNGETTRSVQRSPNMPGNGLYASVPMVQLWIVIQNTGIHDEAVIVRDQTITVDASTRRRGNEMSEIDWDDRFQKRILNIDGSLHIPKDVHEPNPHSSRVLCRLRLFETVIIEANLHAEGCSTTSKFVQRSNFTKVLVQIRDGTTVPLVVPFPRDAIYLLP